MAVYKNVASQKLAVFAYDSTDGLPVTGNAANITAQISLDGAATAATTNTFTELDATDAPGIYLLNLTQAETNADLIVVAPVSATADVELDPSIIYTTPGTNAGVLSLLAPVTHTSAVIPTVTTTGTATAVTTVNGLAANVITATSIQNDAITAAKIAPAAIDAATFAADVDAEARGWVGLTTASLDTQLGDIPTNAEFNARSLPNADYFIVSDYTVPPTTGQILTALGTGTWLTAIPWNAAWDAEVQSEVQDAIVVNHLDHLLAADYDPAAKPGVATALLNEIIESNAGVSRYTAGALAQAPTGGSAPTVGQIADEVQTRTIAAVTVVNGLAANVITATSIQNDAITAAKIAPAAIDAATFAADVDAEIRSYLVDDDTRIDASALNTAAVTSIPEILVDTGTTLQAEIDGIQASVIDIDNDLLTIKQDAVLIKTDVTTLLARITSTLFSGITSLGDWIRRISRKDAGSAGMIAAETEIDTGGTSTFTGTTDNLEAIKDAGGGGGGGDQWLTDVSTGYVYPEAGAVIKSIYEKTALITASNVTFASMVNTSGFIDGDIVIGDDYLAANGNSFQWTFTPNSGFVAATSTFKFGGSNDAGTSTWLVTTTPVDNGNGTWTAYCDMPKTVSGLLLEGMHEWSVECESATDVEITKKRSGKKVKVVRKWT